MAYLIQTRVFVPYRGDINLDPGNPLGTLVRNTRLFLETFIHESGTLWTVFHLAVGALFMVTVLWISRRRFWWALAALAGYAVLSFLASGNVLLLVGSNHIAESARFRAPLPMWIGMLAIAASSYFKGGFPAFMAANVSRSGDDEVVVSGLQNKWGESAGATPAGRSGRAIVVVAKLILIYFAYLWISFVFVFSLALREQQDTLRLQAGVIAADMSPLYRPGDGITFDTRVFTNSYYMDHAMARFPIFRNGFYSDSLDFGVGSIGQRFAELLGMHHSQVTPADFNLIGACQRFNVPDSEVISGLRWEIFRAGDQICVSFPTHFINVETGADGTQHIFFDLNTFPFSRGERPSISEVAPWDMQLTIWSLVNPGDIQWAYPITIIDGVAEFEIPAPPDGWQGPFIVAPFNLNESNIYQHIFPAP
jgi:hypothetical protein